MSRNPKPHVVPQLQCVKKKIPLDTESPNIKRLAVATHSLSDTELVGMAVLRPVFGAMVGDARTRPERRSVGIETLVVKAAESVRVFGKVETKVAGSK